MEHKSGYLMCQFNTRVGHLKDNQQWEGKDFARIYVGKLFEGGQLYI